MVPNQAESYEWSDDGLTLTVTLREGIEFSDGTPLNAEAVVWNWIREFSSGSTGAPTVQLDLEREPPDLDQAFLDSLFAALPDDVDRDLIMARLGAIRAVDDLTVEMHLAVPNGSLVNGFPSANINLIGSPTAYAEMGAEAFSTAPVGAGPFVVTENTQNQRLELERNENYFKDGLPYLDRLTFQSVAGDQIAYQTLQSGQGDVIEGISDVALIEQADNNPDVEMHLGTPTSPYVIQLNTRTAPFDEKRAREAIYYATDFEQINQGLFNGQGEMSQSFTASGGLFHHPEVPGYREYDPEQAAEIVDEIGGLKVDLMTTDLSTARRVMTALQTQWQEAGIDVEIDSKPLGDIITEFQGGQWQAILQTAGAWDPSVGIGVAVRFGSTSPFSGTPLPDGAESAQQAIDEGLQTELDELLQAAVLTVDEAEREEHYKAISQYISDEAYGPFGIAFSPAQVMRNGVHGPGLDQPIAALAVNQGVLYDRVWVEQP
ncbi:ABC transporter substrate-binding protein [Phytoactinopolyspora halotolerans]|uniref:ABC transporter substrate-binding protein n=1 Tax=Phytoactinopolyspora halotolerans TaxID=1981512 RepID=A0A6L9S601_9ACTN|nr:ABC transporter substrate-binding protein [Phytoactinopolyspora halotolerans]